MSAKDVKPTDEVMFTAEDGKTVTDEMIADWESALERDEWPTDNEKE